MINYNMQDGVNLDAFNEGVNKESNHILVNYSTFKNGFPLFIHSCHLNCTLRIVTVKLSEY